MKANKGKYVLVVEGAIPVKENGIYCKIGGVTAIDLLKECAADAAAVIAIGSCASWGGMPSTGPNPTGASSVAEVLGKPVVTIPGCPPSPYNFLATVVHFLTFGKLPEVDKLGRPKFAYSRLIHENCERRAHFDAGRFAMEFGDPGHRQGYCLYKLGCKGPKTHANCSLQPFCEVPGAWPVGIGHPCYGCTEKGIGFHMPIHATIDMDRPTAPETYPPIAARQGEVNPLATGVTGLLGGAVLGAGAMVVRELAKSEAEEKSEEAQP
jgi:hydrogenase small subunit